MKEKYIKQFAIFFKELHSNLQEKDKQLAELFDKIIVWIIGLSTAKTEFQ